MTARLNYLWQDVFTWFDTFPFQFGQSLKYFHKNKNIFEHEKQFEVSEFYLKWQFVGLTRSEVLQLRVELFQIKYKIDNDDINRYRVT